jgi:hypothetical protein
LPKDVQEAAQAKVGGPVDHPNPYRVWPDAVVIDTTSLTIPPPQVAISYRYQSNSARAFAQDLCQTGALPAESMPLGLRGLPKHISSSCPLLLKEKNKVQKFLNATL